MGSIGLPTSGIRIAIDRGGTFTDVSVQHSSWDVLSDNMFSVLHLYPAKMTFLSNCCRSTQATTQMLQWKQLDEFWRRLQECPTPRAKRFLYTASSVRTACTHSDGTTLTEARIYKNGNHCRDQRPPRAKRRTYCICRNSGNEGIAVTESLAEFRILIVTQNLLHIGNQSRPKLFDLSINKPDVLYNEVVEVDERVTLEAWTERKTPLAIDIESDPALIKGSTGEVVRMLEPLGML
jgi:Hydantoinase/oxoprolinase N-terminal region